MPNLCIYSKEDEESGSISWVLLSSLKDHEEGLPTNQRKAHALQGPASQLIKTQKLDRPNVAFINQLFSQPVRAALLDYASNDTDDLWPKNDIEATCEFMENSSHFFEVMNMQDGQIGVNEAKCNQLLEVATYMRNIAIPCGVLVKSTAQGVIQVCNATR